MATEFKTKLDVTRLVQEISPRRLHLTGCFSGTGYRMMSVKFYNDHPGSHGNKSWDEIGYNSAYMRDIAEFFASNGGFLCLTIE